MAKGFGREILRRGILAHFLFARAQQRDEGQEQRKAKAVHHGVTFRKAAVASAIAAKGHISSEAADCQSGMEFAAPPMPPAAATAEAAERG